MRCWCSMKKSITGPLPENRNGQGGEHYAEGSKPANGSATTHRLVCTSGLLSARKAQQQLDGWAGEALRREASASTFTRKRAAVSRSWTSDTTWARRDITALQSSRSGCINGADRRSQRFWRPRQATCCVTASHSRRGPRFGIGANGSESKPFSDAPKKCWPYAFFGEINPLPSIFQSRCI